MTSQLKVLNQKSHRASGMRIHNGATVALCSHLVAPITTLNITFWPEVARTKIERRRNDFGVVALFGFCFLFFFLFFFCGTT